MKTIKTYENFLLEKYTAGEAKKDERRLQDMADRADHDEEEMVKLATTMANRIKKADKAENRGLVAKALGFKKVAKVFADRFKLLSESYEPRSSVADRDTGELILNVEGRKTTWFFINDAIYNGLIEETFDMDEEIIDQYGESLGEDYYTYEDLTDLIREDFQTEVGNLIMFLKKNDYLDQDISSIEISGVDEDGEDWDLQFYLD